jgi:probable rRNA maturation factor
VDVAFDGVRVGLTRTRVAELAASVVRAERVKDALLSVTFVSAREIARLNEEHLGHEGPTDVISFRLTSQGSGLTAAVIADIYICGTVAKQNARAHRVAVRDELARLVIHGTLHALGWEHPNGEERVGSKMWRRQEELLARWRRRLVRA